MNKVLLFVCILFSLIACDDKNENVSDSPIQNLKMPSSETVFATGEAVTIEGIGFNSNSQIWLRTLTKAQDDIQTEITEVNDKSITFIVPENVEGKKDVVLKQEGKENLLGQIVFKVGISELYAFKWDGADRGICKLDLNSKKYEILYKTQADLESMIASEDGKIYYLSYLKESDDTALSFFDLKNNTNNTIISNWQNHYDRNEEKEVGEGQAIGFIKGQLHGLKYNSNKGYYLVTISNNGEEKEIATFGKFSEFDNDDFYLTDSHFEYDPQSNTILAAVAYYGKTSPILYLSFNLTTQKFITKTLADKEYNIQWLDIDGYYYLFSYLDFKTIIRKINPETLETIGTPQILPEEIAYLYYWKNKKLILGFDSDKGKPILESLNINTGEIVPIWSEVEFDNLVAVTK